MSSDLGECLLGLARGAIAARLGLPERCVPDLPELARPGATFVTLTQAGELRGCIGTLEAHRPLRDDVRANALAAAFRDPRFPPLERREFERTRVEVSLLTAPRPIEIASEQDLVSRLRPGIDGVILSSGTHRATFLPQVWESLPDARQFLAHLKHKAGLAPDYWDDRVQVSLYEVTKWKESQPIPTS